MPRYKVTGPYPAREYVRFEVEAADDYAVFDMINAGGLVPAAPREMNRLFAEALAAGRVEAIRRTPDLVAGTEWSVHDEDGQMIIEDGMMLD